MVEKIEFIDDYSGIFLQVGMYDESDLVKIGIQDYENISIELDALSCLRFFPKVVNLILRPGCINTEQYQHLYNLNIKRLKLDYYSDMLDEYSIDLSRFPNLERVFSRTQYNFYNIANCQRLESLIVQEWYTFDLRYLENCGISALKILSGKLKGLDGINQLCNLRSLSLSNQRMLTNISELGDCNKLEILEIDSCNKVIPEEIPPINQLKSLLLSGRQSLNDYTFFLRFPNLEQLLLGVKLVDGNISYFQNLKHCTILTDYRHYSHKNADLPKRPVIN